jgi:hypothetical protein
MRSWIRFALVPAIATALAVAASALALDLDEAKAKGVLGERADGYVGVVAESAPWELVKLADEVNAKRREHYGRIATENGTPVEAVAALAGKKLIEKAPSGQYVRTNGGWTKKP